MIGFLRGAIAQAKPVDANRKSPLYLLVLDVQGVGYDVLVTASAARECPPVGESVQLFTHLQMLDDRMVLYGFSSAAERDLFRLLVGVSGVGSQMAMALLDTLGLQELVRAIVAENTRVLCLAPGVGTKTAQRLALELKAKLSDWRQQVSPIASVASVVQEEVEMTLLALGYTPQEITAALQAVAKSPLVAQTQEVETWLRATLAWLSDRS